jgi:putative two-component system response regulator
MDVDSPLSSDALLSSTEIASRLLEGSAVRHPQSDLVLFAMARSVDGMDGHCERVSAFAGWLGEQMDLPEEQIAALHKAGYVHDIGKIGIPPDLLAKTGPLTEQEWAQVRQHSIIGERMCEPFESFRNVLPIIRHHHERLDGTGYPDGLRGEQIPLAARILQTIDIFDALTNPRTYRRAVSTEEAMQIMHAEVCKGWWDPIVFSEFKLMLKACGHRLSG